MSIGTVRALLLAVRDHLRTSCGLSASECEVMPSGKPPASCGERFVAVHPGGIALDAPEHEYWSASVSCKATITVKAGRTGDDRAGLRILLAEDGLTDFAEQVAKAIHMNYEVTRLAGVTLDATAAESGAQAQPFNEPLRCQSVGEPQDKPASWFTSEATAPKGGGAVGWAIEVRWSAARRPEALP